MGLVLVDIFITEKRKDGGMLRGYRSSLENRIKNKKEHEMLVKKKTTTNKHNQHGDTQIINLQGSMHTIICKYAEMAAGEKMGVVDLGE